MIALEIPIRSRIPFDAFTTGQIHGAQCDINCLWFAACSSSKPGFNGRDDGKGTAAECWTLISTPEYAFKEIQTTQMQDEKTGDFRPQQNDYLNEIPGPTLYKRFMEVVGRYLDENARHQRPLYQQAQRWGSGLPAPWESDGTVVNGNVEVTANVQYLSSPVPILVYPRPTTTVPKDDFVADDNSRLYYAGDFVSYRNPGFEAAALSAHDLARHLVEKFDIIQ